MYHLVIGLEIHIQSNAKTKMFSRVPADYFHKSPNELIDPVSFGLPGALPVPNKNAFEKSVRFALALNCKVNPITKFDRKHYFYPDLPKGYQISQYDQPIGEDGYVEFEVGDDSRRIRIERIHLEEDTAKSMHMDDGKTYVDYNKSGIALYEIVTKPEFNSTQEVIAFGMRMRQIAKYIDASDAEMQKGQMRFELNMSLQTDEQKSKKELPNYKIEVKNIGSISVLEKVIQFEAKRQAELLNKGETIRQQTRGLKDMSGETVFQRYKENADDYRYFPEPDIAPITISDEWLEEIKDAMPLLPLERKNKYLDLGLEIEQADIFIEDTPRGDFFDSVLEKSTNNSEKFIKEIAKWVNGDIAGLIIKKNMSFDNSPISEEDIIYLITMIDSKKITGSSAKSVLEDILKFKKSAEEIVKEKNLLQIQDDSEIEGFIKEVIEANKKVVEDIQKNPNAIKFLVGQVMRISKGRVNPNVAEEMLKEELGV